MREPIKITKSVLINSILITFLLLSIVSCRNTSRVTSSTTPPPDVKKTDSNKNKNAVKAEKVIAEARSYIGTHYKYGGCTRDGIDCSGLMYNSFKTVNIELPRTSTEQSKVGKSVELEDLQPGDLLFFTDKKGNTKVSHVGMVTEVKNGKNVKFIHSSTHMGVIEADLYAEYHISLYLKATRVL